MPLAVFERPQCLVFERDLDQRGVRLAGEGLRLVRLGLVVDDDRVGRERPEQADGVCAPCREPRGLRDSVERGPDRLADQRHAAHDGDERLGAPLSVHAVLPTRSDPKAAA